MRLRRKARERGEDDDTRSAYPNEWVAGEHLANFLFRDWVYVGAGAPERKDIESLAEAWAEDAELRFLSMKGLRREQLDGFQLQALRTAFAHRLASLLETWSRVTGPDDRQGLSYGLLMGAMVGPTTAASAGAFIAEANSARREDDLSYGPLTELAGSARQARGRLTSVQVRRLVDR